MFGSESVATDLPAALGHGELEISSAECNRITGHGAVMPVTRCDTMLDKCSCVFTGRRMSLEPA
jgi:hypothetical protein